MEDEENNKYVVLVKEEKQLKCREHKREEGNEKKIVFGGRKSYSSVTSFAIKYAGFERQGSVNRNFNNCWTIKRQHNDVTKRLFLQFDSRRLLVAHFASLSCGSATQLTIATLAQARAFSSAKFTTHKSDLTIRVRECCVSIICIALLLCY